jgi:hypothetical protein
MGPPKKDFSVQRADPSSGHEHDRADAAEVGLRHVYAELSGMVGRSHKCERRKKMDDHGP